MGRKAVCLVSGGLDSCVAAAEAVSAGYMIYCLHAQYGQLTESKEAACFHAICDLMGARDRLVVGMSYLSDIGGSALTDPRIELPKGNVDREDIPVSYVPFRNANLLAAATSWAEVVGAEAVFIGAVQEDSSGYPDCRKVFFEDFQRVIASGTRPDCHVKIMTPLLDMTKADIVRRGLALGAPLEHTWSCYRGRNLACGRCDSCLLRLRGFQEAGIDDPIDYVRNEEK